jgi:hypothetical protein
MANQPVCESDHESEAEPKYEAPFEAASSSSTDTSAASSYDSNPGERQYRERVDYWGELEKLQEDGLLVKVYDIFEKWGKSNKYWFIMYVFQSV